MARKSDEDFSISSTIGRIEKKEKAFRKLGSGSSDGGGIERTIHRIDKLIKKIQERRAKKKGTASSNELAINILNLSESDKSKINAEIQKLEQQMKMEQVQIAKDQASIKKLKALL